MEIFLVRHTRVGVERGICYGFSDIELADTVKEDMQRTLDKLPRDVDAVISSPLKRCALLAEAVSPAFSTDGRLKELNFGRWEMQPWNALPPQELEPWLQDFVSIACPGGECYGDMHRRSTAFYEELTRREFSKVVVVTHGGFIRTLLAHILSIPLEKSFSLKIDYGSVSKVDTGGKAAVVQYVNL